MEGPIIANEPRVFGSLGFGNLYIPYTSKSFSEIGVRYESMLAHAM